MHFRIIAFLFMLFITGYGYSADNITKRLNSPEDATNQSQEYLLGRGDLIRISVYGSPDMLTEARLSEVGTITFPLLGEVSLGGLSPKNAEAKLTSLLEKGGFLKNPQVNVMVLQYQSYAVSVLGDVYKPGKYTLDKPSKLSDVLAMAGGATSNGSDIVTLIRTQSGKTSRKDYDLRDLFNRTDSTSNPLILSDDIIFINAREVSVLGQVNRPGKYSVSNGVRTVLDFLAQAGGVSVNGGDKVFVMTRSNGKLEKREVDLDLLYRQGDLTANIELANGDSIYVPRFPVFYIYGEVQRPGSFRLERNMNVAQALSAGGGLTPRGTQRGIKVKRQVDGTLRTLDVDLGDKLLPDDILYVEESLF